jgi:hypothetical protein
MHEQDVRRAVGNPGGLDSPAARHTVDYLVESLAMVLAKRAGAPAGTTLVVEVEDSEPAVFGIGDDGKGGRLAVVPDRPTARICLSREAFVVLAGGRRAAEQVAYDVSGDVDLAARVLATMAVTP